MLLATVAGLAPTLSLPITAILPPVVVDTAPLSLPAITAMVAALSVTTALALAQLVTVMRSQMR